MEKSGYHTRAQEEILEFLKAAPGEHYTAMDIRDYFDHRGDRVGTATIYRQLDRFVEEGRVQKYVLGPGQCACYAYVDTAGSCSAHFHCKCEVCGRLIHLDCGELQEIRNHLQAHHGFLWNTGRTVFYGTCANCAGSRESAHSEEDC